MDNFSGIHIGGGPMSSDFRDRGGGVGGGGIGHLEEFAALDGSTHAHAAADDFSTDLFCFLVEGVLIMVILDLISGAILYNPLSIKPFY